MSIVNVMPRAPEPDEDDKDTISITVRFPASVRDSLKKQAKDEERTFNTVVVRACRAYLEEHGDLAKALGTFKGKKL